MEKNCLSGWSNLVIMWEGDGWGGEGDGWGGEGDGWGGEGGVEREMGGEGREGREMGGEGREGWGGRGGEGDG